MAQTYLAGGYGLPSTRKAEILSSARYLPSYYTAKADKAYSDKMLALRENEIKTNIANAGDELGLQKEIAKQNEKQDKIGNALGVGKLGLDAYYGFKEPGASSQLFTDTGKTTGATQTPGTFGTQNTSDGGGGFFSGIKDAVVDRPIGTGLGAVGGYLLADELAKATGMNKDTASVVAPVAGAVAGNLISKYAEPAVSYVGTNYAKPAYDWVSSWVSSLFG